MNASKERKGIVMNARRERGVLERKVFDAEIVSDVPAGTRRVGLTGRVWVAAVSLWSSTRMVRVRSIVAYRFRKLPRDVVRLVWFVIRGHGRWIAKGWTWATYGDLRADARAARLAGEAEARRKAQELIRSDAKARWGRMAIVLHRCALSAAFVAPVAVVLWCVDSWMDRADMWPWLAELFTVLDRT